MTYNEFIQNIIDTRGQWNIPDGEEYENHHIVPLCVGGLPLLWRHDTKHENLIWLTYEEHYTAHELLANENPHNSDLVYAFWCMCSLGNNEYVRRTKEEYANARRLRSNIKDSDETRKRKSESHKGKNHTQETKDKQSASMKGKNTQKHSIERRQAQSNRLRGIKRDYLSFSGKHHSEETKKKISKGNKGKKHNIIITNELRIAYGNSTRGTHWYNNGVIQARCIEGEQPEGFIRGKINVKRDKLGRFTK